MDFQQVCRESGLQEDSVAFYVSEKLINPIFPGKSSPEAGEYAEEDLLTLHAISNLRKLQLPVEEIRKMLYDPSKAAGILLEHYSLLNERQNTIHACLEELADLDLAQFNEATDVLRRLADMEPALPLPKRDINQDRELRFRESIHEKDLQIEQLQQLSIQKDASAKKLMILSFVLLFIVLLCAGFILGPYILW